MSDILDYIILVLIFAIIINVLMQAFGKKCSDEHMEEKPKSEENVQTETKQEVSEEQNGSNLSAKAEEAVDRIVSSKCPIQEMDHENDRYIKDFALGGKFNCGAASEEPRAFSRQEINDYQNEVFGFNDNINKSSSAGVDAVDKLNEMYTGGNNELVGNSGKKISEVFDRLTQNEVDKRKKCANPDCLIPPQIETEYKTGSYLGNANIGKVYTRYNWRYEDDNVNTGGKFYDDIEACDSEFEPHLVWNK
jgi:hypothetical protein